MLWNISYMTGSLNSGSLTSLSSLSLSLEVSCEIQVPAKINNLTIECISATGGVKRACLHINFITLHHIRNYTQLYQNRIGNYEIC